MIAAKLRRPSRHDHCATLFFIIVEHMVYCTGLVLVGVSAARFAGDAARIVVKRLLPVLAIFILLSIAKIVVKLVRKRRRSKRFKQRNSDSPCHY
ncbi:MAG: hypothetical protein KKD09_01845 [Gammaproteobacteria bacterium]|nr:hypothetical protein [Gammaproteobacteria bacterium]MBU4112027.1 hypothetical protein [Gammaproteobacteria bacterium]